MAVDTWGARALSPELVLSLRQAFARELEERLPVLEDALAAPKADLAAARRAAHALGSSAYVVDEPDLAVLARDVEARLEEGRSWQVQGHELVAALSRWTL
jgi:HPt (histidine-containing phosphotransfer) domain-containing protein